MRLGGCVYAHGNCKAKFTDVSVWCAPCLLHEAIALSSMSLWQSWQPIETMPNHSALIVTDGDRVSVGRIVSQPMREGFKFTLPTHWMLLPNTPVQAAKERAKQMTPDNTDLKALLTTWREKADDYARTVADTGLWGGVAMGLRNAADELEAALLALGERQETAEPPQIVKVVQRILNVLPELWGDHVRNGQIEVVLEESDIYDLQAALAAHREGPVTAEHLDVIADALGEVVFTPRQMDAIQRHWVPKSSLVHREGRPPAADTLKEDDLSR